MSNTSLRKIVVLAVNVGLLIAVVSGGAVTYASFTDSGSVDVTFTAGNISSSTDQVSGTETTGNDNETSLNDSDTTTNETSLNDSDTTTNETSLNDSDTTTNETNLNDSDTTTNETNLNDSERLSGGLSGLGVPTTRVLNVGRMSDGIPAAAVLSVGHSRLLRAPPPRDR